MPSVTSRSLQTLSSKGLFMENHFPTQNLLSHAEVGKDVVEDVFGGDFAACDFAKVMEAPSEVFGHKVCRGLVGKGFLGTTEGF